MKQRGSLLWIIFLLAALFLGPTMILKRMGAEQDSVLALRATVAQERLMDAPAPLPSAPAAD